MSTTRSRFELLLGELLQTTDQQDLVRLSDALDGGKVSESSIPLVIQEEISGDIHSTTVISALLREWKDLGGQSFCSTSMLSGLIRALGPIVGRRPIAPELVWSGPSSMIAKARATSEVLGQLIRNSKEYLLLVGYSFSAPEGARMRRVVSELAGATARGVQVTFILHRSDANLKKYKSVWPPKAIEPRLLTWDRSRDEPMVKLHAKLLLADDRDMLVTSANFTYLGLEQNMELGLHIQDPVTSVVADHFSRLEEAGIITPWVH